MLCLALATRVCTVRRHHPVWPCLGPGVDLVEVCVRGRHAVEPQHPLVVVLVLVLAGGRQRCLGKLCQRGVARRALVGPVRPGGLLQRHETARLRLVHVGRPLPILVLDVRPRRLVSEHLFQLVKHLCNRLLAHLATQRRQPGSHVRLGDDAVAICVQDDEHTPQCPSFRVQRQLLRTPRFKAVQDLCIQFSRFVGPLGVLQFHFFLIFRQNSSLMQRSCSSLCQLRFDSFFPFLLNLLVFLFGCSFVSFVLGLSQLFLLLSCPFMLRSNTIPFPSALVNLLLLVGEVIGPGDPCLA
mmetsp:Transcript_13020/g.26014  ORF Transcript_13020/g.26014 Transcript_13020/m.26014 type:complete len:297 (+) Transcript_13020:745-1635(+)